MLTIKNVLKIKKNFKNPLRESRDTRNNLCHVILVKDLKKIFIFKTFLIVCGIYGIFNKYEMKKRLKS